MGAVACSNTREVKATECGLNLPGTQGSPATPGGSPVTPNLGRCISKSIGPISMKLKNHLGKCMNFNVPALHGFVPSFNASILRFTTSETQKHKKKIIFRNSAIFGDR